MNRTPGNSSELDEATLTFIEDFAFAWGSAGNPRMEGRVFALLLITNESHLSLSRIAELLKASTGAVSMSTRALMNLGFIKPHSIPGDRNRYFHTEQDVWGSFLAAERKDYTRINAAIEFGIDILPDGDTAARTRLDNALRYMNWLDGYHKQMLIDWEKYRDSGDRNPPAQSESS